MSIEDIFERIAVAVEILAGVRPPVETPAAEPASTTKVKGLTKAAAKKAAAAAKALADELDGGPVAPAQEPEPEEPAEIVTRKMVEVALTKFIGPKGENKARAIELLGEFEATNIGTLDEESYGDFIQALVNDIIS